MPFASLSCPKRVVVVQPMHNQHTALRASKLRAHTSIRNALNLDRHTLGQLLDGNTAARRLVGEVLLVHAVHLGEVCHVVEEDVDLDDPVHGNTRLGENTLDVLTAHLGLVCDAALDQVALGIGGDLTGDEDIGACNDGLCLWCAR